MHNVRPLGILQAAFDSPFDPFVMAWGVTLAMGGRVQDTGKPRSRGCAPQGRHRPGGPAVGPG